MMAVCAPGAKSAGAPIGPAAVGGCTFNNNAPQNTSTCQPFMLGTISAEGTFPIVPFQQYGTSAFAVPSFEEQQRLTFGKSPVTLIAFCSHVLAIFPTRVLPACWPLDPDHAWGLCVPSASYGYSEHSPPTGQGPGAQHWFRAIRGVPDS
jgi:hypothetical protein